MYRPPLDEKRIQMLKEITCQLNQDALYELSLHDVLNMCIDRAYLKMFPNRQVSAKKRKKYIKIFF